MTPTYIHTPRLARLDGYPVGIFANDNRFYAGSMSADASQKVRRLIDLCQQFHIPIITLQDQVHRLCDRPWPPPPPARS
jgi:hypothetical protein